MPGPTYCTDVRQIGNPHGVFGTYMNLNNLEKDCNIMGPTDTVYMRKKNDEGMQRIQRSFSDFWILRKKGPAMKRLMVMVLAATILAVGYSASGQAKEPVVRDSAGKTVTEGNRHRRNGRRGRGNVWFGVGGGGYYGPRYHAPRRYAPAYRGYYYAPPPPPVYYAPPPPPVYYVPAPGYHGGVVVVR